MRGRGERVRACPRTLCGTHTRRYSVGNVWEKARTSNASCTVHPLVTSKGIFESTGTRTLLHEATMRRVSRSSRSHLLMHTATGKRKWWQSPSTRSRSCMPEGVGSVTSSAKSASARHEITGHPMPGGPSLRACEEIKASNFAAVTQHDFGLATGHLWPWFDRTCPEFVEGLTTSGFDLCPVLASLHKPGQ